MSRTLTASDRSALIKLASTLPKGSPERKAILAGLGKKADSLDSLEEYLEKDIEKCVYGIMPYMGMLREDPAIRGNDPIFRVVSEDLEDFIKAWNSLSVSVRKAIRHRDKQERPRGPRGRR